MQKLDKIDNSRWESDNFMLPGRLQHLGKISRTYASTRRKRAATEDESKGIEGTGRLFPFVPEEILL